MDNFALRVSLSYSGASADEYMVDFYDIAQALLGFQRSWALTTHLVLHDQIITQAPSLRDARIIAAPPVGGSWEIVATVLVGAGYLLARPKDTVLGHIIHSAYDYVVSQALGFHVDYDKSLGQKYKDAQEAKLDLPSLDVNRLDSLIEKCERAISDMHRPMVMSRTAERAVIGFHTEGRVVPASHGLDRETYDHVRYTIETDGTDLTGRISSYNINTFNGRIFIPAYNRPIPFVLEEAARTEKNVRLIVGSLAGNAQKRSDGVAAINVRVKIFEGRTGRVKSLRILDVQQRS